MKPLPAHHVPRRLAIRRREWLAFLAAACWAIFVLCPLARAQTPAPQPAVELTVAPEQPAGPALYRLARIRVDVPPGHHLVQAVRIRDLQGGPTVVQPLTVPPGTSQSTLLPLPAWSQQHTYRVELLQRQDDPAPAGQARSVSLAWPADILDRDAVFAPWLYEPYYELPRWPGPLLRDLFLLLAVFALACAGLLLVRHRLLRPALLIALSVLAGGGAWLLMDQVPLAVHREVPRGNQPLHVLSSRRSVQWTNDRPLWPVYFNPLQMRNDDMIIHAGRSSRLTLHPDDVRILRPGADKGP